MVYNGTRIFLYIFDVLTEGSKHEIQHLNKFYTASFMGENVIHCIFNQGNFVSKMDSFFYIVLLLHNNIQECISNSLPLFLFLSSQNHDYLAKMNGQISKICDLLFQCYQGRREGAKRPPAS